MKKYLILFFIIIFADRSVASTKNNIIKNLENIQNLTFNFEQNINGKIENGHCQLEYPKKIFCEYNLRNKIDINIIFFIAEHLVCRHDLLYLQYLRPPSYQ